MSRRSTICPIFRLKLQDFQKLAFCWLRQRLPSLHCQADSAERWAGSIPVDSDAVVPVVRVIPDVTRVVAGLAAVAEANSDVVISILETVDQAAATQERVDRTMKQRENFWRTIADLVADPTAKMIGTVDSTGGFQVPTEVGSVIPAVVVTVQVEVTVHRREWMRP